MTELFLEKAIHNALWNLNETNPRLMDAIAEHGYFVSHITERDRENDISTEYVVIDCIESVILEDEWYRKHTIDIYNKFMEIPKWYSC